MKTNRNMLYFAYGEHMNEGEMLREFPAAKAVGTARLNGFRLCFAGRDGLARPALLSEEGASVPGRVWQLPESDADALDRSADPHTSHREIRIVEVDGVSVPALVYVTTPGQPIGRPGFVAYDVMREAYESLGEDMEALRTVAQGHV